MCYFWSQISRNGIFQRVGKPDKHLELKLKRLFGTNNQWILVSNDWVIYGSIFMISFRVGNRFIRPGSGPCMPLFKFLNYDCRLLMSKHNSYYDHQSYIIISNISWRLIVATLLISDHFQISFSFLFFPDH